MVIQFLKEEQFIRWFPTDHFGVVTNVSETHVTVIDLFTLESFIYKRSLNCLPATETNSAEIIEHMKNRINRCTSVEQLIPFKKIIVNMGVVSNDFKSKHKQTNTN